MYSLDSPVPRNPRSGQCFWRALPARGYQSRILWSPAGWKAKNRRSVGKIDRRYLGQAQKLIFLTNSQRKGRSPGSIGKDWNRRTRVWTIRQEYHQVIDSFHAVKVNECLMHGFHSSESIWKP